jgi:hypothetical protein
LITNRSPNYKPGLRYSRWVYQRTLPSRVSGAGEFLAAHARDTRALQLRWNDGHIYAEGNEEESYKLDGGYNV